MWDGFRQRCLESSYKLKTRARKQRALKKKLTVIPSKAEEDQDSDEEVNVVDGIILKETVTETSDLLEEDESMEQEEDPDEDEVNPFVIKWDIAPEATGELD